LNSVTHVHINETKGNNLIINGGGNVNKYFGAIDTDRHYSILTISDKANDHFFLMTSVVSYITLVVPKQLVDKLL